jgi:hypothetical protein
MPNLEEQVMMNFQASEQAAALTHYMKEGRSNERRKVDR